MSDITLKDDEIVKDVPIDLDSVHEKTIREMDEEIEKSDQEIEEDNTKDSEEEREAPAEVPELEEDKPNAPEVPKVPEPEVHEDKAKADFVPPQFEELPKVVVKDSEGKTHEFETVEDIPDDFEPFSYKEYGVALNKLTRRELTLEKQDADLKLAKDNAETEARIKEVQAEWDADIAKLAGKGEIPKDETKRKETVDGVFILMQDAMNKGRAFASFEQAFEVYSYRQGAKDREIQKAKSIAEKKKRGGMIQGGGSAAVGKPNGNSQAREAPPTGLSLDQIHERAMNSL